VSESLDLREEDKGTNAVKSALPVTALEVSDESFELHTAPLWPGIRCETDLGRKVCVRTHEGADPVADPISEHWFAVFAAGDE
jgi:hypothetical protein